MCGNEYLGLNDVVSMALSLDTIQAGLEADCLEALAAMGLLSVFLCNRLCETVGNLML